ncbi:hypothetical protein PtA15_11A107 [Puccinia triticina]|uniref:Myb-like domain-containing protein n=1 Tax=Puccinia triticina TaxID=208348 RepID=A0ABY7CVW8_9BASI|nr:uncharacterized protein PtA15_11A107 [Puccinia triticina]WAQ89419.1 hypothetical protein PtA15_11A107 [Puccinia triticina]
MSYNTPYQYGTNNNYKNPSSHSHSDSPAHPWASLSTPLLFTSFHHLKFLAVTPLHQNQQGPRITHLNPNLTPHIPQLSDLVDQLASSSEYLSSNHAHQRRDYLPHYNSSPSKSSDSCTPLNYNAPSMPLSSAQHTASPLSSQINFAWSRAKRAPCVPSSSISSTPFSGTHLAPPGRATTNCVPPPSTAPLASLKQTRSRKRKKIQESDQPATQRWSHEELMKLTEAQLGVKHKSAMTEVSDLYHQLTPQQQAKYQNGKPTALNGSNGPTGDNGSEMESDYKTNDDVTKPGDSGTRKLSSFKAASDKVQNFMDNWFKEAVHIARTANCEMILFAVSQHLAVHSFQFGKATHGATKFLASMANLDGTKHYPARMQAYLTSYEVSDIAKVAKSKQSIPKPQTVSAAVRMSELIAEKTNGILTQWPWTKHNWKLAKVKYKLTLLPGAKTQLQWLKKPSRGLHADAKATIHLDLDNNLIDLIYDPTIPNVTTPKEFYAATSSASPLIATPQS